MKTLHVVAALLCLTLSGCLEDNKSSSGDAPIGVRSLSQDEFKITTDPGKPGLYTVHFSWPKDFGNLSLLEAS